jgi:hypothetical protein
MQLPLFEFIISPLHDVWHPIKLLGTERLSFGWDEKVCVLVEMGFTGSQASHALNVCGGNTKDAYDFLSSSNELVSSSRGGSYTSSSSFV